MSMRERRVEAEGVTLQVVEAGPSDGPVVLLCHGWPESWYSWRHQIEALAEAGYRAVAYDGRGYGRSSCPTDPGAFTVLHLVGDAVAVVRSTGARQAVMVGHDWGAIVGWFAAVLVPEVFRAVVNLSVPYQPGLRFAGIDAPPTQVLRQAMGDQFHYMLFFQEPGAAEADMDGDPERVLRCLLRDPGATTSIAGGSARTLTEALGEPPTELPGWLSPDDLSHLVGEFQRAGFGGGVSWYRNLDRSYELLAPWRDARVEVPAAFIGGRADGVVLSTMPLIEQLPATCTDLRGVHLLDGVGHWTQQEAPEQVNRLLIEFCETIGSPS